MHMENKRHITIYFDDEAPLLQAVRKLRENNEIILDVLTPFPVHGLDRALQVKQTRIPLVGLIFGILGAILAFIFQSWVMTTSYPLIIGGKPLLAIPSFIPITFECTVLFASLAMVVAFLVRSNLKPDIRFVTIDERITDNVFIILIEAEDEDNSLKRLNSVLSGIKIIEIK